MDALSKSQILDVAGRWKYSFSAGKKGNMLSLRAAVEEVRKPDQKISVKYIEKIYDLLVRGRAHMIAADVAAFLSTISDEDVRSLNFSSFNAEVVQRIADSSPRPKEPRPTADRTDAPVIPVSTKADFSHLPSGHQTLLGAGNVVGNGISAVFLVVMLLLVIVAIGSIFGG